MPLQKSLSRVPSTQRKLSAALVGIVAFCAVSLFFQMVILARTRTSYFAQITISNSLRGGLDTSTPHRVTIIDIISATSFPIDSQTGKIKFPQNITTVVLDVGARTSDYLSALEKGRDPTVALILIDPLPDSSIPLMKRVAEYSMQGWKGGEWFLDERKSNRNRKRSTC